MKRFRFHGKKRFDGERAVGHLDDGRVFGGDEVEWVDLLRIRRRAGLGINLFDA